MFKIRVSGRLAIFTRPELKVERISYPVITPSAARGVLEAVFWKPAIVWRIHQIAVLNEIKWIPFRRNEVDSRAPTSGLTSIVDNGGRAPVMFADESKNRAQRNTVALRDVDYEITASFEMTDRAGPDDNENKFSQMITRRLSKGQHFQQPYLGTRECVADVWPSTENVVPIDESKDLGLMLYDIDFSSPQRRPLFFHAEMKHGVITIPDFKDVLQQSSLGVQS
jgi:CRISPR-associated protein Cas5d